MAHIQLQIITPLGTVYTAEVSEITLPTYSGVITVRPYHIALISTLKSGTLFVRTETLETPFAIHGGSIEVKKVEDDISKVIILTDRSERATEIDTVRAEEAYKRAKELADGLHADHVDFARFEALMEKELNRVHVGTKYR